MTPSWDKTSNDEVLIFTYSLLHHELTFSSVFLLKKRKETKLAYFGSSLRRDGLNILAFLVFKGKTENYVRISCCGFSCN